MHAVFWALLGAGALLWPSRVSGPLDGMPLDQPAEVFLFGVVLPVLALATPATLRRRAVGGLIVALLAWKAVSGATLVQDGWCARFETPAPLFREMGVVPHSWDVRADWRSPEPRCSAIVDRPYPSLYTFPVWFYNLPPASDHAASDADRPPLVRLRMTVSGTLHAAAPGVLRIDAGEDMEVTVGIDGVDRPDARGDIPITAGTHEVTVTSQLQGERWRFEPLWNGASLWSQSMATTSPASWIDRLARPWARVIPLVVVAIVLLIASADLARVVGLSHAWLPAAAIALFAAFGRMSGTAIRAAPALLAAAAPFVPAPLQNTRGFLLLVAAPFLAWFGARAAGEAGVITFYTSGDDWWMFQRFAYRIYLQGYWLEGGQPTFWFQPLYRWIAGALHMVFGDSSAGELVWDAWCVLAGGWFAFAVVRGIAGFRWGIAAAATTLLLFTIGPAWYLFGRGLSEISSMGFLYAAALLLLQVRRESWGVLILAGVLATLAFYTRLNNLPAVLAVVMFALPLTVPVSMLWQPRGWLARASRPAAAAVLGAIAAGLWFFTWRTYHFTGVPNMLHGTQAGPLAVWQSNTEGLSAFENTAGSLLMVLFMSDPPRFDLRALPIVAGVGAAVLGLVGAPVARRLPMNVVALCLAGVAGSLIARGTAYPGRFSVHIIPAAVALAVCTVALIAASRRETAT